MADPRLPDVVPHALVTNTKHDCFQGNAEPLDCQQALPSSSDWNSSVVTHHTGKPPLVQIWTSTEDDGHVETELPGTPSCGGRRCSTLSEAGYHDSGIDSQLASPTPGSESTDRCPADNFSNAGCSSSSGSHLAVPKLVPTCSSLSQKRLKLANSPNSWRVTVQDEEISEHHTAVDNSITLPRVVSSPETKSSAAASSPACSSSPRSSTLQRSLAQAESGLTAWRLRSDSLRKMRLSITDETLHPHIRVESPVELTHYHQQQQQHRSLDGANQKHHKSVATRFSLDERFTQQRQKRVSVDESSTATSTRQGSISNLSQESTSSVQLPDFTKSISDCYSSSEEEPATFSRHPSFCSVRSDFAAVGAAYRDEGEQKHQLGRLLSRSSSRPLYLSVPPRLANIQWSTFAQSQPCSRRPSTLSQVGSMSSLASRFSLTNRSLSSAASPYCRLDRQRLANEESIESANYITLSHQDLFVSNALSLTQRLAFPQLASPQEGGKSRLHRDGHIETESNLNFFAKIITFLVLVFAIVLFVGVLIKLHHGPQ